MEEGDDGTFEFGPAAGVDGIRREGFPDDVFANVGSDKQGNARAETITLGEELVEEHDDQRGRDELEDEEQADTGAKGRRGAVHAREDVHGRLAEGDDECEYCCIST